MRTIPALLLVPAFMAASASAAIVIPTIADASGSNAFNPATTTVNGSGLSGTLANGDSLATALGLTHAFNGDFAQSYVSNASGTDYFAAGTPPVIIYDLGSDVSLANVILWQYQNNGGPGTDNQGNHTRTLDLRINTAAQGFGSFSGTTTSITMLPVEDNDAIGGNDLGGVNSAQNFALTGTGRYVQVTFTDNYRNFQGITVGGDRVGLGEIAFNAVPEPSAALLGLLGAVGLFRRRR